MSILREVDSQATQARSLDEQRSNREQAIPESVLERGRLAAETFFNQPAQEKSYTEQTVEGMARQASRELGQVNFSALSNAKANPRLRAHSAFAFQGAVRYLNFIRNTYAQRDIGSGVTVEKLDAYLIPCLEQLITLARNAAEDAELEPTKAIDSLNGHFNRIPELGSVVFTFLTSVYERVYS